MFWPTIFWHIFDFFSDSSVINFNEVSSRLLKETFHQVAPALTLLFQASLDQGKVLDECKSANTTPLFKKWDRSAAVNYRPVSLTSVCSKVMEHIVHSHIISHLDSHGLLTDSQHGFRKRRSTGTQLILSVQDLAESLDIGEQVHTFGLLKGLRQGPTQQTTDETTPLRHQRPHPWLDLEPPCRPHTACRNRRSVIISHHSFIRSPPGNCPWPTALLDLD